jgi:phage baseplate assembly protein W
MTSDAQRLGRGIAFPPSLGPDKRWAWSEGETNIRQSVRVILMTNLRERLMLPQFGGGLAPFLFEPNTVTTRHQIADRIAKALAAWEPRLHVESVAVAEDPDDPQSAIATVTYTLVATAQRERVSLSVTLAG